MSESKNKNIIWWTIIIAMIVMISVLHYTTSTMKWQYHLIYMQSYFIPILVAAFQFGVRGGILSAVLVSILYLPHVMLQWGGLVETNMMRFLQIFLFYVIGYLTGFKAQREMEGKKRFQETASELERHLQILNEQTEQLSDLEEQLRQYDRLSVIGELTASLAHEVRNPLGSIRGAVEIITAEETSKNKKTEFSKILVDETKRMTTVLENYLSFAKKKKQQESEYVFQEIIQNVIMMLSTQARKRRIDIVSTMPDDPILLKGDPNDLWQILMNIILNSIQAMIDGGTVTLKLIETDDSESDKKDEDPTFYGYDRFLNLTISDTGPGISTGDLEKIFKPFYTTKINGSGLGLAIVKRIIDGNNWKIDVTSTKNSGTEFVIIIPIKFV